MVSLENLTVEFGGFTLFRDISFMINPAERIGLVGKNGAGKSTLLKLIAGEMSATCGVISKPNGLRIGYLPQQMKVSNKRRLFDEAQTAFTEVLNLKKKVEYLTHQLEVRTDHESSEYFQIIDDLSHASDQYHLLSGDNIEGEIEQTLIGLGFSVQDFNRSTAEFSGGWRMRIELAKILMCKPDLLLLDEPTNHLDIESIEWLEVFLAGCKSSVLLISHDRRFLDNVTTRTIEISACRIYDYKAAYSDYIQLRAERREHLINAYRNQQRMIDKTEEFIERFRYKATKAVQVQSRIKQLEKIERIEIDMEDISNLNIRFPSAPRSGEFVVEMSKLSKAYSAHEVLHEIDLTIRRGECVGFIGKNGEGKTTLSRIITGDLDFTGYFKIGYNVNIGYFAQNQDELLDEDKTVFQTIDDIAVGDIRTKIRDILGAFLFGSDDIDKKVKVLSGGERSRLAIAKLLLKPYNLLVLDEPTNHLDMHSKDVLKQALLKFEGTIILVSHDREFLHGLATVLYEFKEKKIKQHLGDIYDFLQKRKISSLQEMERKSANTRIATEKNNGPGKQQYANKKLNEKELRKAENLLKRCEDEVAALESELETINLRLADPEFLKDSNQYHDCCTEYSRVKKKLDDAMHRWEVAQQKLDYLKTD